MRLVKYPIHFVNGGDGTHAHPSQALLDFYTMLEKMETVEGCGNEFSADRMSCRAQQN